MSDAARPLRVAVIEDHALVRKGITALLERWPQTEVVVSAGNGVEYEQQCRERGHVDVALVDLFMPKRDGFETIRWIVRHQPRTLPMAITFAPEPVNVQRAIRCGARAVLPKTVEPEALMKALEHVRLTGFHYNELVSRELRRKVVEEEEPLPDERWARLSPREREFVLLYTSAKAPTSEEVALRMGITAHTAETYRKNAALKLNVRTKPEMVRLVVLYGWK